MAEPDAAEIHAGWGLYDSRDQARQGRPRFALHIGRYPLRKRIALYVIQDGRSYPLAYFRSERHAREAVDLLGYLIPAEEPAPDTVSPSA